MKKQIIKGLTAILALSLIANVTVFAEAEKKTEQNKEEIAKVDVFVERKEAKEKTKYIFSDKKKTEKDLTYSKTRNLSQEKAVDIYVDEKQDEYRFDEEGNMIGYFNHTPEQNENLVEETEPTVEEEQNEVAAFTPVLTEEEKVVADKAWEVLQELYGDCVAGYTLYRVSLSHENQTIVRDLVTFSKQIGKNGFVTCATASVCLDDSFTVIYSNLRAEKERLEFDESRLDGLSYESMEEWVTPLVEAACGDQYASFDMRGISLVYENGKYALEVTVNAHFTNGRIRCQRYYYDLGE